jgi:HAD superfamily hydrolase (TIGR01509 family)
MPRAVLFDFNGVLIDDEPLHLELLLRVLGEEGVAIDREWARTAFLGHDDRSCLAFAAEHAGAVVAPERTARLVARKAAYYREEITRTGYAVVPGAAAALARLDDAGIVLGVVTGALRHEVEGALAAAGARDRLRIVVAAEDVRRGKPDPEGYLAAIAALAREPALADRLIHPHEIVAVEDSPAGLAAAATAGLRTLGIRGAPADGAEAVIESVAELTPRRLAEIFG